MIVRAAQPSAIRQVGWDEEFGVLAESTGGTSIDCISEILPKMHTYLSSFTTAHANKIVRNSVGTGSGLEAWRRIHAEYDPASAMRRVVVLGEVQNPPKCASVDQLGSALEDWLTKKKHK